MLFVGNLPMKKWPIFLFIFFCSSYFGIAQQVKPMVVRATVVIGDTIPVVSLREVEIFSLLTPTTRREQRQLTKLIRDVKKVYPYARLAGMQLQKYNKLILEARNEREARRILKEAEKELNARYGDDLKNMTFSQGRILIKLIDRETGECSYNLVEELRGNFTAFFYQAFARLWGYNLKVKYDPEGEDKQIETIVKMIERGQI
ncbi:MAG: DUF4294 domain-containing protein [Bacteroidetes bacterium CG_4_9_14_3_um_filter_41_19]|nr:MAG: DUF4294 domain-containing protein [Bacteroidetes bacterium CG_4_9_14_3_um_filter_41_19]